MHADPSAPSGATHATAQPHSLWRRARLLRAARAPAVLQWLLLTGLLAPMTPHADELSQTPASVRVQPLSALTLNPVRDAAAVIVPRNQSRVASEVGGVVLRWTVDVGAQVKRGDLLVALDATDAGLARDQARAALNASQARDALAQEQLARARSLVAQGFMPAEALSAREAEARLAAAESQAQQIALRAAERVVAKTRVVAPFDASVQQRMVQSGETVAPGAPLYLLVQSGGEEVAADLSPEDAAALPHARDLRFVRSDGQSTALALGRVAAVLNSPSRTVSVRLLGPGLVAGSHGRLVWLDPRPHLPASVLVRRNGVLGIFRVADGRAVFEPVAGAQEGRATPATMAADTPVVSEGQQALRHGERVSVAAR